MGKSITPPGDPVPLTSSFGFTCKWCGKDRQVVYGTGAAHECTVHHSVNEDFSFVGEQIRIHEGWPSPAENRAAMRQAAEEAIRQATEDATKDADKA